MALLNTPNVIAPSLDQGGISYNALSQGALENTMRQIQNQYQPAKSQADINSINAMTNKINQMTPGEVAKLALSNQKATAESPYWGPQAAATVEETKQRGNYYGIGGGRGGVVQQDRLALENQVRREYPEIADDNTKVSQVASAYINGDASLPDGTPIKPASGEMNWILGGGNKHIYTAQAQNQQRYADTTETILEKGDELIPSISKYTGALGKVSNVSDALASSFGQNSKPYQDYIYFTRTYVPYAAGEMMRSLGVNASDQQKDLYSKVINPLGWDSNYEMMMNNWKRMRDLFHATSRTIAKFPGQTRSSLINKSNSSTPDNGEGIIKYSFKNGKLERTN